MITLTLALLILMIVLYFTIYGIVSKLAHRVLAHYYVEITKSLKEGETVSLEAFGLILDDVCSTIARWTCLIVSIISLIISVF